MLKLTWIEFFLRLIPEGFLFIYAGYVLNKQRIDRNRYLLSSILLAIITYLVRSLPINYGVHTLLGLISYITLLVIINKFDMIKSISIGIITIILGFISEGINVFLIQNVFKVNINAIFKDPILKSIYGIPSMLILGFVIFIYYCILSKRKELN